MQLFKLSINDDVQTIDALTLLLPSESFNAKVKKTLLSNAKQMLGVLINRGLEKNLMNGGPN